MGKIYVADYSDSFEVLFNSEKRKLIIYGAGNGYLLYKHHLPKPDMICDRNAKEIGSIDGMDVSLPEDIQSIEESVYIVVTVIDINVFEKICDYLETLDINATVFHASNNSGIECTSFWGTSSTYHRNDETASRRMRINLVCNEPKWILHKFAIRMQENMNKAGIDVTVSDCSSEDVDINHHIQFATYETYPNDTLMITHIDCGLLFERLKEQLKIAKLGICMSKETMDNLVKWGIDRQKLCYINPAHDGIIRPRKKIVGITHKTHEYDMRKRISALYEMLEGINPCIFKFAIMGDGWTNVISKLNEMGFETDYYPDFDMDTYVSLVPSFDYYLFFGFDEGSMGYLDALAAGVKTIVTPQGFHLDNDYPIDYSCTNIKDFHDAFMDIQKEVERRTGSVADWTWENYTKKHIAIWEYILRRKNLNELYADQLRYEDGIYSMFLKDNRIPAFRDKEIR